jgi:hypothetical protein
MVLFSGNTGKYLTKEWENERTLICRDSTGYTAAELAYYEISPTGGEIGQGDMMESNSVIYSSPIDQLSASRTVNIRELTEKGMQR